MDAAPLPGDIRLILPEVEVYDQAFRSWVKDTRRLLNRLRCPICQQPARVHARFLTCAGCHRAWKLDDIIETSDLLDSMAGSSTAADSPGTQPGSENPNSSNPGCVHYCSGSKTKDPLEPLSGAMFQV